MTDNHPTDAKSVTEDINSPSNSPWLVIGWFTSDYRPLAEKFAANLQEYGVPFHLFSRLKRTEGWNTQQKPAVILEAMATYPDKTLILMDVDCVISGDVSALPQIEGDIGITITATDSHLWKSKKRQHWLTFETSSRVLVVKPTEGARSFIETWQKEIEKSNLSHDEYHLAWSYLKSPGVRFSYLPPSLSGREVGIIPGALIAHQSAHSKHEQKNRGFIKRSLREIEKKFFRTGKTRARKVIVQLS